MDLGLKITCCFHNKEEKVGAQRFSKAPTLN